jgi:hypothetical protein
VWKNYDFKLQDWPILKQQGWLNSVAKDSEYDHWFTRFDAMYQGKIDTWDYQVVFMAFRQRQFCAVPRVNLISNLGFRADATHTTSASKDANLATQPIPLPLTQINDVTANGEIERAYIKHHTFSRFVPTLLRRLGLARD